MQDDELNIEDEFLLVQYVKDYFKHKEQHSEKVPQNPEQVAGPEVWSRLTDAERKARIDAFEKGKKSITSEIDEQRKKDTKEFHTIGGDPKLQQQQSQFYLNINQRAVNRVIKDRLTCTPVTEAEKAEIFRSIRWNLMTHEQLVETSMDSDFEMAKAYILDGLSNKLVNFEKSSKLNLSFNVMPRTKYPIDKLGGIQVEPIKQHSIQAPPKQGNPYAGRLDAEARDKWAQSMIPNANQKTPKQALKVPQ